MPKGSDDNWLIKMNERLMENAHYIKPRLSNPEFIVKHYADNVAYAVAGFMEKNKVSGWRFRRAGGTVLLVLSRFL